MMPMSKTALTPEQAKEMVHATMTEAQIQEFEAERECNFAIHSPIAGRFRISAFYQRNFAGMVLRRIETEIPSVDDLMLPDAIKKLAMAKRGLIIFVGATGTGKSTSLASMIGYRNQNSKGHIITIEDPIEFVHEHRGCMVTQREVGVDTPSFEIALKNTLRQAPDVIMIGEIRTLQTMDYAVAFAETGHLCLATLHANNANQALDRIICVSCLSSSRVVLNQRASNLARDFRWRAQRQTRGFLGRVRWNLQARFQESIWPLLRRAGRGSRTLLLRMLKAFHPLIRC